MWHIVAAYLVPASASIQYVAVTLQVLADAAIKSAAWYSKFGSSANNL
jgi:hypothetical protein